MVEMNNAKVFGIGFNKTGTSCLDKALEILGYRVCRENFGNKVFEQLGYQLCLENLEEIPSFQKDIYKPAHSLVDKYDAFQDVPWFLFYEKFTQTSMRGIMQKLGNTLKTGQMTY